MNQLLWERVTTVVLIFFAIRFPKVIVAVNGAIPAFFSFGDSILDTGNNNDIPTLIKANYPPYGKDFPEGIPTGRFCNGKNPSDLIVGALGIKDILPAYLSPELKPDDLATGVCFASAGSGIDDLTGGEAGVLTQPAQLKMLREYIIKLTEIVGPERANDITSNSVYLISAGNNDVATTYNLIAAETPFPVFVARLIGIASNFFKSLYEVGARRVWVMSTLPLGCLPGLRSTAGGPLKLCAQRFNIQAQIFNAQLSLAVNSIKAILPNYDIRFIDVYTPLLNLIQNPQPAGFEDVVEGCCGSVFGLSGLCSLLSVCPNTSSYIFWDAAHPTERAYQIVVSSILKLQLTNNGSSSFDLSHLETLGIKDTLPAYLSDNLSSQDLITGVCFASAGSGIDDLTARIQGVLSQPAQLGMFKEYIGKLTAIVGQQRASDILSNSVYLVSAGNNDIAITYSQILAPTTPFSVYVARLIETGSNFLKSLYTLGARRVWVFSTLPLGCLPGGRSAGGGSLRVCALLENQIAQLFNAQLSSAVNSIRAGLPNYDIRFIDVYNPLLNLIQNPQPAGFVDVADGCCGTGPFGASGACTIASVCPNPSTYVFWDLAHPTERAYQFVVSSILKSQNTSNDSSSFALSRVGILH